jgi:hypothetical protein
MEGTLVVEMGFEDLFIRFWWLIFPIFGMLMAFWGMASTERRSRRAMELIDSYVRQGKEPPAELLKIASGADEDSGTGSGMTSGQGAIWTLVTFTAVAAGFGVGYQFVQHEKWAFAFLIVAVIMAVLAVGSAIILLFGPRPQK